MQESRLKPTQSSANNSNTLLTTKTTTSTRMQDSTKSQSIGNIGSQNSGKDPQDAKTGTDTQVSYRQRLETMNESCWVMLGKLAETIGDLEKALYCYDRSLIHNPYSAHALSRMAILFQFTNNFRQASEIYQRMLNYDPRNGEAWGSLGHCYLVMDELAKAYNSYQQALLFLKNPRDPRLWFGIGVLYEKYSSLEHAEEAFSSVLKIDPKFEKAAEVYYRLALIYKQMGKFDASLHCLRYIMGPVNGGRLAERIPKPLTEADILFQIGHVHELSREFPKAKGIYDKILLELNPNHLKTLNQMGWLLQNPESPMKHPELCLEYLKKSVSILPSDPYAWYLLGRCYVSLDNYEMAHESYQKAVNRDGRNPLYWCSIGVLYFISNQYRDSLDAYTRAIKINPYMKEVWYNLGVLYESCNGQTQDALDAYQRVNELDPENTQVRDRINYLMKLLDSADPNKDIENAIPPPAATDVNPNNYRTHPINVMYQAKEAEETKKNNSATDGHD